MLLIGITGSIGSGKSTVSKRLQSLGYPVFDADACVHALYQKEAVQAVGQTFPKSIIKGKVDRGALSQELSNQKEGFKRLESIIHPLVKQKKHDFLQRHLLADKKLVFFDIPLLFETNQQNLFDFVVVISVTEEVRVKRVLARKNMTEQKLEYLLKRQMPDKDKIKRADYVIYNNSSIEALERALDNVLLDLNTAEQPAEQTSQAFKNWDL